VQGIVPHLEPETVWPFPHPQWEYDWVVPLSVFQASCVDALQKLLSNASPQPVDPRVATALRDANAEITRLQSELASLRHAPPPPLLNPMDDPGVITALAQARAQSQAAIQHAEAVQSQAETAANRARRSYAELEASLATTQVELATARKRLLERDAETNREIEQLRTTITELRRAQPPPIAQPRQNVPALVELLAQRDAQICELEGRIAACEQPDPAQEALDAVIASVRAENAKLSAEITALRQRPAPAQREVGAAPAAAAATNAFLASVPDSEGDDDDDVRFFTLRIHELMAAFESVPGANFQITNPRTWKDAICGTDGIERVLGHFRSHFRFQADFKPTDHSVPDFPFAVLEFAVHVASKNWTFAEPLVALAFVITRVEILRASSSFKARPSILAILQKAEIPTSTDPLEDCFHFGSSKKKNHGKQNKTAGNQQQPKQGGAKGGPQ
jgi:hypothetical protein